MEIQPLFDRVLVRRTKGAERTRGGIIIPESSRDRMGEGEVVAVGPGRIHPPLFVDVSDKTPEEAVSILHMLRQNLGPQLIPVGVAPGQKVLFDVHAGTPVELNRVDHVLLRESDILGVVTGEDAGDETAVEGLAQDAGDEMVIPDLPRED